MRSIAIIGSGPTAIYTLKYLLMQEEAVSVTLFEQQSEAGKGTPYHQSWNDREMLANIASAEIPPITETLVSWLGSRTDDELVSMGIAREDIDERAFFPRVALGEYFHAQLEKLVREAGKTGSIVTIKTLHKVTDVKVSDNGITVSVRGPLGNITDQKFDYVVMATGHAWPKETEIRPGYFLSPWPPRRCGRSITVMSAYAARRSPLSTRPWRFPSPRGSFVRGGWTAC